MVHGSLQLDAWLKRSKLNQRQGAKRLGMHWTTLNKLVLGIRFPSRLTAIRLEQETGIPVGAWTPIVPKRKKSISRRMQNGQQRQGAYA